MTNRSNNTNRTLRGRNLQLVMLFPSRERVLEGPSQCVSLVIISTFCRMRRCYFCITFVFIPAKTFASCLLSATPTTTTATIILLLLLKQLIRLSIYPFCVFEKEHQIQFSKQSNPSICTYIYFAAITVEKKLI